MDEIEKKRQLDNFDKNVKWLRDNVAPDDIYDFAEQALLAADHFIMKWKEWVDVYEEASKDPLTAKWLHNIVGLRMIRDMDFNVRLNTEMKDLP